ncbi:MAG TPA: nitrilase-related carbon-nitrogen hydrolase, partial [Polyangiaceae bacterium]|nr:nitrilase-related carbon-nitrogen hydrolase [Polyangiaceae bacterium]
PAGDEAPLTARLGALAAAEGVYLLAGLAVLPEGPGPWVNQLVAFRPDGGIAWTYQKARPVPGEPIAAGDGRVRVLDTPYGRLAALICFDADFPELARQAGRADADVLLIAANDWPAVADAHADMARLRGVETGASIVRATGHGVSLAADREGRVLARGDDASAPFLLAEVPLRGGATPYARAGDVVGWAAAGLLALALLGVAGQGAIGAARRVAVGAAGRGAVNATERGAVGAAGRGTVSAAGRGAVGAAGGAFAQAAPGEARAASRRASRSS